MAEERTIESWGAVLNIEGEKLTIERAMLLHLGHQNARLDKMLTTLIDMQMRVARIEFLIRAQVGAENYDAITRQALRILEDPEDRARYERRESVEAPSA